ncbi:Neutral alpha-glucosidase AB [Paramicrosporidium saccamoebae]|uniref:Glucosidase II subunit alpha n=1 Tax=Paramicrosporidium saccamoebae TaxID=1246581 RepID=A0A2H9TPZ6_9FUNG|nr:Neutral alpha-glucosidase AB [Paramicrosporidium saccamoebae]
MAVPATAVKRHDFKTCQQSGFCSRLRGATGDWEASKVRLHPATPENSTNEVWWSLKNGNVILDAKLIAYEGGMVRLQVDEVGRKPTRYRIPSNDIVLEDQLVPVSFVAKHGVYAAEGVQVRITPTPFKLTVEQNEKPLIELNGAGMFNFESTAGPTEERFGQWSDPQPHGLQALGADIVFMDATHLMGIPEHATSLLLKSTRSTGETPSEYTEPYRLYNLDVFEYELDNPMALYGAIPFMLGVQAGQAATTGVFWNNPSETWIDVYTADSSAVGRQTHFMSEAGILDLFFFHGPTAATVLAQYYQVTGTPQLPPLFALGYHQCRWNYVDEDDLLEVNEQLDANDIPADVLWLDIEHTDGKRYFTWNKDAFPDPVGMQKQLVGRKLVTIVDPHLKKDDNYVVYRELVQRKLAVTTQDGKVFEGDCWPGRSVWPDFSNPLTRTWWKSLFNAKSYPGYTDTTYVWNDMNEPSVFNSAEITMPKSNLHGANEAVEHRNLHNLYGHYQQWATHTGLATSVRRPFVLTRAFYAGTHRTAFIWTGDNAAAFSHLRISVPMILSLGMTGMALAGADVGGFFGNPDPQLLVRWYQLAALQPFFRAHAHIDTKRREPWLAPEPYRRHIRDAIVLRYQLLPYIYTLAQSSSQVEDQFMLGDSLLVKAIGDANVQTTNISLPTDTIWYDYHSQERILLAGQVTVPVVMDRIPIFARGGRIIPRRCRLRRSASLMQHDPFTLTVFLDGDQQAHGRLYIDDGSTFDYRNGGFLDIQFAYIDNILAVKGVHGTATHLPAVLERVIIVGLATPPETVVLGTAALDFEFIHSVLTIKTGPVPLTDPAWKIAVSALS